MTQPVSTLHSPHSTHHSLSTIFMGTPEFAVPALKALIESGHNVVAVYTQPPRPAGRGQKETPSPVHKLALAHGIPVYTPVSLKSTEVQEEFRAHKADVAVVAAYGLLLPKAILEACPMGCVNIHPSLLPRWRGAAPIQRTIMAGDTQTGIVIMQMDEGLDTGGMLLVERHVIAPGTTSGMLHDQLSHKAAPLLLKALEGLADGSITATAQPGEGITYAQKISKAEALIDWSKPAEEILHQILGLNPFPGANFVYSGESIKIWEAAMEPQAAGNSPGTVVDQALGIACGNGVLKPLILQRPGKTRMHVADFLNGFPIPQGTQL